MKKVLFLDHASVTGGAQLVLLNYLKYLNKEEFASIVACSGKNDYLLKNFSEFANKVYTINFEKLKISSPAALIRFLKTLKEVINIIKEEKIDVVLTNTERAMYVGTVASFLTGKKVIWFIRDFWYNKVLFKLLSIFPSRILCVSKSIKEFYGNLSKSDVLYVSSDMYKKVNDITAEQVSNFKKKYDLENKFVVGFVGRLAKWKGVEVVTQAILKSKFKEIILLVVGEQDEKDRGGPVFKVQDPRVIYTGFIKEVELVLSSLDVFVHPALEKEPFATSVVEAMMAKVPVIATNLGGTAEIVFDNMTGLLIEPNNAEAIEEAVEHIYHDRELGKKLSKTAYEYVIKNNKIEDEVKKIEEFLND